MPVSGDALLKCFSLHLYGFITNFHEIRIMVVDKLLKNLRKYKHHNKNTWGKKNVANVPSRTGTHTSNQKLLTNSE